MKRVSKTNYYLDIAEAVSSRSTCMLKKYGCIIVKNDEIISTGYSGAPRGRENCIDLGFCTKKKIFPNVRHSGYDACRSVHAEQNAIISASRRDMIDSSLYLVGVLSDGSYENEASPCQMCRKMIINSGITTVYARVNKTEYKSFNVEDWIKTDDLLNGKLEY